MITNRALARTTFAAPPEEDLAAPDVYEIKTDAVINKLPLPVPLLSAESLTNEFRGGKSMLGDIPGLDALKLTVSGGAGSLKEAAGKATGFLDSVKQIGSTMSKAAGGIAGIKASVQGVKALANMSGPDLMSRLATGNLNGVPGLQNTNLGALSSTLISSVVPKEVKQLFNTPIPAVLGSYSTVGNTLTRIAAGKTNDSYQMSSLINNVMGNNSVGIIDKDSTARLITGLAMGGASSGVNNAFSSLLPLAGGDKQIQISAAMSALTYSATSGNIHSMKDVVKSVGANNLTALATSTIRSIANGYNPTAERVISNMERRSDFNAMASTFTELDQQWLTSYRMKLDDLSQLPMPDFKVTDISLVREGTDDFKKTMVLGAIASDDSEYKYLASVAMFPPMSPEEELRKNFPFTLTSISSNTLASNTVDTTNTEEHRRALKNVTIDGKYGDIRDDVQIDGVSANSRSDTAVVNLSSWLGFGG